MCFFFWTRLNTKCTQSRHIWAEVAGQGCWEDVSYPDFFLLRFIIRIGLHSKQITTGLEGTAADKPKQAHSCFSSCTEASQWEDISRSCFGRHHKTLLCAVLDRECRESVGCFRVQIRPWPKILCLLTSVSSLCLHLLKFCLARVRELYNTVKTKQVWALKN